MLMLKHPALRSAQSSYLAVIDVQEKLVPVIADAQAVLRSCRFLMQTAQLLKVPILVTEQYPRGLGRTVPELLEGFPIAHIAEKMRFSAADALESLLTASTPASSQCPTHFVLAGIETHICILQTALELLQRGYQVTVVRDATSSRSIAEADLATQRLLSAGVVVASAESVVFEWCDSAEHPQFRALSQLVRSRQQ
jgi:nicotinamidase-related amidase